VHEKTGGNPFFAIQFLSALAEEADHEKIAEIGPAQTDRGSRA
jgi:predicted ATPase